MRVAFGNSQRIAAPLDQLHTQGEAFLTDKGADDIEQRLVVCVNCSCFQRRDQNLCVAGQVHRATVDQRIEISAVSPQCFSQCRGIAQYIGYQV